MVHHIFLSRGIAQLVEQRSPKPRAEGSNPSAPAKLPYCLFGQDQEFLFLLLSQQAKRLSLRLLVFKRLSRFIALLMSFLLTWSFDP